MLITPCGGTGTVLTFLQPGATAIIMNYYLPSANSSTQMESLYYWCATCYHMVALPAELSHATGTENIVTLAKMAAAAAVSRCGMPLRHTFAWGAQILKPCSMQVCVPPQAALASQHGHVGP